MSRMCHASCLLPCLGIPSVEKNSKRIHLPLDEGLVFQEGIQNRNSLIRLELGETHGEDYFQ